MKHFFGATFVGAFITVISWSASANPPIEAYGKLPEVSQLALSADGSHIAYFLQNDDEEILTISELGKGVVSAGKIGNVKGGYISFVGNDYVVLTASRTTRWGSRRNYEYSGAISIRVSDNRSRVLLKDAKGVYSRQTGLGRIVGFSDRADKVFMPAFMETSSQLVNYNLLIVDLDTGKATTAGRGSPHTNDWIVGTDGTIFVREDYDEKDDKYSIKTKRNGKWENVYEVNTDEIPFDLVGLTPDKQAIIIARETGDSDVDQLFELSFEGKTSGPIFQNSQKEIQRFFTNPNRDVIGIEYAGPFPTYEFFDDGLTQSMDRIVKQFDGLSVKLKDWSDDFSRLLLLISGSGKSPTYYLFDRTDTKLIKISSSYKKINDSDVGEVLAIEYKARDGNTIPAIVTFPPDADKSQPLPLIVLPHGGPSAHDTMAFDWLSQYFANRGYLILQPNFRGSTGYGREFRLAGYGQWGAKIQSDITDGVNRLLRAGWAQADRTCIIGASFGGYAALAGGAFTPDLYKCVGAIAPVSDTKLLLDNTRRRYGIHHRSYTYWQKLIGDRHDDIEKLNAISPVNHADAFKAAVLLIHGDDDSVVDIRHSKKMESALKKAGKSVKLVKLKNEDHWLSQSETRLQTLRALDAFVTEHIGQ